MRRLQLSEGPAAEVPRTWLLTRPTGLRLTDTLIRQGFAETCHKCPWFMYMRQTPDWYWPTILGSRVRARTWLTYFDG